MKIYFAANYSTGHHEILSLLMKIGKTEVTLSPLPELRHPIDANIRINQTNVLESFKRVYQTYKNIKNSDVFIAETTVSSISLDYQITLALDMKKPVILLYQKAAPEIAEVLQTHADTAQLFFVSYTANTLGKKLTALLSRLDKLGAVTGV